MSDYSFIYYGLVVSILPTASMLIASLAFHSIAFNIKLSPTFESTTQNLCAGDFKSSFFVTIYSLYTIYFKSYSIDIV